jgi:hypothetical protein
MKRLGLDFTIANSWTTCVGEMAQRKGLDIRSAAWKLTEDLKAWQELGGFEAAIQNAKHQLELLDIAIEDKKQAIATLVDLRKMGIYELEIAEVVETIKSKNNGHGRRFDFDTETDLPQSHHQQPGVEDTKEGYD